MLDPELSWGAWTAVSHLESGEKITTEDGLFFTFDPQGIYSSRKLPRSAVNSLKSQGVIGEDLELTPEGRAWLLHRNPDAVLAYAWETLELR